MNLSDIVHSVLPSVEGCPRVLAMDALQRSAYEFCAKTLAWRVDLAPFDSVAGESYYTITLDGDNAGLMIVDITQVKFDGEAIGSQLGERAIAPIVRKDPAATPEAYACVRGVLVIGPAPDHVASIEAQVALAPSGANMKISDYIAEHWSEAIVSGALYRLMVIPNKAWSNSDLAIYHRDQFNEGISSGRAGATDSPGTNGARLRRTTSYF